MLSWFWSDRSEMERSESEDIIDRMRHRKQKSVITWILTGICVAVFIVMSARGDLADSQRLIQAGASYTPLIRQGEYYRFLTCMFIHLNFRHLVNNMILLVFLGDYLERFLGKIRFLLLYLAGGVFSSWFSFRHEVIVKEDVISAGASGAIFAMIGALIVLLAAHRGQLEDLGIGRMILMAGLSLYTGFRQQGVDGYAHLGGLIGGALIAVIFLPGLMRGRRKNRLE